MTAAYDDMDAEWVGAVSTTRWVHLCMGSEGCMVKEDYGDIRLRPRRIASRLNHANAQHLVDMQDAHIDATIRRRGCGGVR